MTGDKTITKIRLTVKSKRRLKRLRYIVGMFGCENRVFGEPRIKILEPRCFSIKFTCFFYHGGR